MPYCAVSDGTIVSSFYVSDCSECPSGPTGQGTWAKCTDNPNPPPFKGTCFIRTILTRSLGDIILILGTTYGTQLAFRDKVLNTSSVGRRFVKIYYRYNPKALELVIGNPTLLGQAIHAWLVIAPFVRAVVASSASEGNVRAGTRRPIRLTPAMHGRVVELLRVFRRLTPDKGLRRAVTEVEAELRNYVGLTPEEALQTIRRSSRQATRRLRRRK